MIIRETPKDIDKYIRIFDEEKIIKLGQRGFNPKYIDKDFAYFEDSKELIDAIVEIIQNIDNKGV